MPDSNQFHDDISWMKDNGITNGCNPAEGNTRYCPTDNVTRQQMAAFMRRLAENQVVDAAELGGLESSEIAKVVGQSPPNGSALLDSGQNENIGDLEVEVGADGFMMVTAQLSIFDVDDNAQVLVWTQLNNTTCQNTFAPGSYISFAYATVTDVSGRDTATVVGTVAAPQGVHTVTLCAREFAGGDFDTAYVAPSINVVVSASGSADPGTLSLTGGAPLEGTSG